MKLYRPNVPDSIKIAVAYKILPCDEPTNIANRKMGTRLYFAKVGLSEILGCPMRDLRLDHDPPLAARPFNAKTRRYTPDANDPEHLFWITASDHRTKTIIRGQNGQYSDIALIKRERRRRREPKTKKPWAKGRKMQSRPFPTRRTP